jgi:uncharacterized protein with PIN domain
MTERFAADRMLGRVAKMLRLLGYDTLYSPQIAVEDLQEFALRGERMVLTRGQAGKRFPCIENVYSVRSELAPEQLRELVGKFRLDTKSRLWTRCTRCNAAIVRVDSSTVKPLVQPSVFQLYDEFFRCAGCGHIYWKGSHVERVLKNLAPILSEPSLLNEGREE